MDQRTGPGVRGAARGRSEPTTLADGEVRDLVEKMLKTTGRRMDLSTPFADANRSACGAGRGRGPQPRPYRQQRLQGAHRVQAPERRRRSSRGRTVQSCGNDGKAEFGLHDFSEPSLTSDVQTAWSEAVHLRSADCRRARNAHCPCPTKPAARRAVNRTR
jgi:hypothetical protein